MKKLNVHYSGWGEDFHLATLAEDREHGTLFEYTEDAIERNLELSALKYPLSTETSAFTGRSALPVPGFVHDSLPDGWGLLLMDRAVAESRRNPQPLTTLDRLAIVGMHGFGALRFAPPDDLAIKKADAGLLALARAIRKVERGHASDLLPLLQQVGSPQGARPKAAIWFSPATRHMSTAHTPDSEPWLVKFPAKTEKPEVCAIEAAYSQLAARAGIRVPRTEFFEIPAARTAAFGTARFDRHEGLRVPIQSVAAVLDVNFREAMMDYRELLHLVMLFTQDRREVEQMFLRCLFNVIFHNRDDHLKNFAFRMERNGTWKLSPAFDLTFSEGPSGEHWNTVMGKGRDITRNHLLALGKSGGLGPAPTRRLLEQALESAGSWPQSARQFPISSVTRALIQERIHANAKLCIA